MKKKRSRSDLTKDTLLAIFRKEKRPLSPADLVGIMNLSPKQTRILNQHLRNLTRGGSIVNLTNKRYGLPQEMNLITGTLWCTRSGSGFVVSDKEGEKDLFVPARSIKNAFHGDKVVARLDHSLNGRREGTIIKVTQRKMTNLVGFVRSEGDISYVVPEDERVTSHFIIRTSARSTQGTDDDLVAARITRFPEQGGDPACHVLKVFKGLKDVKSITQFVQYKYALPFRFKRGAEQDAKAVDPAVGRNGRLDLRDSAHITIDGELAKDFDDAVFVTKNNQGFALYVSIADVSHYVARGSSLDSEAYSRGTSVYFPSTVVPMLPKRLSNGLCSLNPDQERLTVTAKLTFNLGGDPTGSSFHKSIIRSAMRLTYNEVEDALRKRPKSSRKKIEALSEQLELMGELATLLAENRAKRGSLDFDLPEPEVILDIAGGIKDILRAERLFAHKIIEEFMLSANEAVAQFLAEKNVPTMYRIHEAPDPERLKDFQRLLRVLSIGDKKDSRSAAALRSLLKRTEGTPHEFLVNRVLLRSMKQAKYSAINKGHFGLASSCYLHFTSPIRRYPDLICHRVLKSALTHANPAYTMEELERMAVHLSERERLAMEAEREIEDRIRVLFMKDRIGAIYEGIISHITSFGFFVELFDVFVEGLVLLSDLCDDYYRFEEERFRLIGRRSRKIYRIGDKIRVRVMMANVEKNQLHFVPVL